MNIYTPILFIFFSTAIYAQSYNKPESVDFDSNSGLYFISNSGEGSILSYDPATENLQYFATNVGDGPHGLEVVGNELYVCSGSMLKAYDLTTQEQTLNIDLGASFANGITHKGNDIFVTDFIGKDIYRFDISSGNFNTFIENIPHTPNGIFYDYIEDRLLMVCWYGNAPIYEISLTDSSYNVLTTTTLENCDGIAMDSNGDFYVSAWSNNAINKFNSDFSADPIVVVPNMSSPADIYYNTASDTLAIPNSSTANSSVVFIGFGALSSYNCDIDGCTELLDNSGTYSSLEECEASCNTSSIKNNQLLDEAFYPNPLANGQTLELNQLTSLVEVYDLNGKLIFSKKIDNEFSLKLPFLDKGIYLLKTNTTNEKILIQ